MQTTLTQIFIVLNQFHTVCPKIETKFLGKLGNSKVFSAQNQMVYKKKKVFTEIETDFSAKIGNSNVLSAQNQVVSKKKKKKRSSPKLKLIFRPHSEIQTFEGGCFPLGGSFQFFTKNRPQKHQKRAIFHTSQANGGDRAPPPPSWLRYSILCL